MKERLLNLYNISKNAAIWTLAYWACAFVIFRWLFNFNIFSGAHWHHVMHAHLTGFAGLTFGIVALALLPIYISTTAVILRTGKPLITIPLPPIFTRKPAAPEPAPAAPDPSIVVISPDPVSLPPDMPAEMRAPYLRARRYGVQFPAPKPAATTDASPTDAGAAQQMPGELPIPTDFDFDSPMGEVPSFDTPVFSDINFDTPPQDNTTAAPAQTDAPDTTDTTTNLAPVTEHLHAMGREFKIVDDLIICDDMVIATHTDPDFWVADDDNWFAAGKTRPSPIMALNAAAGDGGRRAILYLGATNIMDIETLRPQWESEGITIITDLSDLDG